MSSTTSPDPSPSFPLFPTLPTELRLKIWSHVHEVTPAQLLPLYLCKSDLDYLRIRRKACHNYAHIFCGRVRVPAILHVCRESRSIGLEHYSLGFDISRILSLGKADTDIETYTTCSHEIAMEEESKAGVYWDRSKDVVVLETRDWVEEGKAAYVWGGKTGVRFGKMKRVAIDLETLTSCGIGEYLEFEGVDEFLCFRPEDMSTENQWVRRYLAGRGMVSCEGGKPVTSYFSDKREVVEYLAGRSLPLSLEHVSLDVI